MMRASVLLVAVLSGYWSGVVTTPGGALPIGISLDRDAATLDAPPLGYADKPLKVMSNTDDRVQLELRTDEQSVTADLVAKDGDLRGAATVGSATYPMMLHRGTAPSKTYKTEEVTIRSDDANLAATLYLPNSSVPVPAIVFVAGLVPRSDSVHFLADQFANRGIAVLTYDHRGIGKSTGDRHARFDALAGDAAAAVRYVGTRKEIDPTHIGIRGQSQGAWIAPLAAMRAPVAFAILTAGGGVSPWQSETYAIPARMRADGFSNAEIAEASQYLQKMFEVGRTGNGWEELSATIDALRGRGAKWFGTYGAVPPSLPYLRDLWRGEFSYDPRPALQKLTVPVLALEGEKDVYSPPADSLRALETSLGSRDKTLRIIPGATHDFHVAGAPLPLMSDEYLSTVLSWTAAHAGAAIEDPAVNDHRVVSKSQHVAIDVDPSLQYVGRIGIDIRNAAHAERVIFASADSSGRVRALWVAQFEKMLPAHSGTYDRRSDHPVQLGPLTFNQQQGKYSWPNSIASKPGSEADQTHTFLERHGLHVPDEQAVARFETQTDAARREELIIFYWGDLESNIDFAAFAEKAKTMFRIKSF